MHNIIHNPVDNVNNYLKYVYKGPSQPAVIHNPCAKPGDRHPSWTLYAVLSTEGVCHRSWTLWVDLSTSDGQFSHLPLEIWGMTLVFLYDNMILVVT